MEKVITWRVKEVLATRLTMAITGVIPWLVGIISLNTNSPRPSKQCGGEVECTPHLRSPHHSVDAVAASVYVQNDWVLGILVLVWGQHVIVQYLYPLGLQEGMGEEVVGAITGDYAGTAIRIRAFIPL